MDTPVRDVDLYTDGAASPNPGPGGYGVVLIVDGQRQELSGGFRRTTNNRMELMGVIVGLRSLRERSLVRIYSDSKYVVDMFMGGYAEQWRQNRWRRQRGQSPALNPDLWDELLNLSARHEVRFEWVRGHAGNRENARGDELAVAARQGTDLPLDAGYENALACQPTERQRLFDL